MEGKGKVGKRDFRHTPGGHTSGGFATVAGAGYAGTAPALGPGGSANWRRRCGHVDGARFLRACGTRRRRVSPRGVRSRGARGPAPPRDAPGAACFSPTLAMPGLSVSKGHSTPKICATQQRNAIPLKCVLQVDKAKDHFPSVALANANRCVRNSEKKSNATKNSATQIVRQPRSA